MHINSVIYMATMLANRNADFGSCELFRMRQVLLLKSHCSTRRAFLVGRPVGRSEMHFLPKFRNEFEEETFDFNP